MINMTPLCDEYEKLTQSGEHSRARKIVAKIECAYDWFKAYGMVPQAMECERALIHIRRYANEQQKVERSVSECVQCSENGSIVASEVDLPKVQVCTVREGSEHILPDGRV